jgi:hypothetical protein
MERKVDPIEQENDELHRRIAAMIRRDPSLIERARAQLERWLANDPIPAWLEWRPAFTQLEPDELAAFLESTTPRARRMKISSPFSCLLR